MGKRVMIVDDLPDVASTLGQMLEALGCQTRVFHDGKEALAGIPALQPDIAFLDLAMPGIDGLEVARRIRASGHDGMLLVAVTGLERAQDRETTSAAGFDLLLVKPVRMGELRAVLDLHAAGLDAQASPDRAVDA